MKLYDFPLAPNPRKLRVYLAEKGIEIPKVRVDLTRGEQNTPEFLAKNRWAVPCWNSTTAAASESLAIISTSSCTPSRR
jgi:glutathione S-transferase